MTRKTLTPFFAVCHSQNSIVWDRLAEMTDTYGHRLAGSASLEKVWKCLTRSTSLVSFMAASFFLGAKRKRNKRKRLCGVAFGFPTMFVCVRK